MKRVVCIGGGLAAIYFSLVLSEEIELYLILGEGPEDSNSYLAKGGIAVSLDIADQSAHIKDTLIAGAGLCDPQIVKEVIENSSTILQDLKARGLYFDSNPSKEGGHSIARIQHISDQTGKFLVEKLWADLKKRKNTHFLFHTVATQFIIEKGICKGLTIANFLEGTCKNIFADNVVLASGGCGNLYAQHTNGIGANGEGAGMAMRAGLLLQDMAFIQFHPTKMYLEGKLENILVTEAFRGAGAVLRDKDNNEFMKALHPLGSLAPRDIVSLGMFLKMEETQEKHVWLDFSQVDTQHFMRSFPYLFDAVKRAGFLSQEKIPVTPAAHYQCGGVAVDSNSATLIPGLFALGEVARTGLHGANRLASNSLLELFHFAAKLANSEIIHANRYGAGEDDLKPLSIETPAALQSIESSLKELMWHSFGICRSRANMETAKDQLQKQMHLLEAYEAQYLIAKRLRNRIETATAIANSALARKESLGCHQLIN